MLLIVASLLVRALDQGIRAHPGFEYRQVITIDPGLGAYAPAAARAHIETLRARLVSHSGSTQSRQPQTLRSATAGRS